MNYATQGTFMPDEDREHVPQTGPAGAFDDRRKVTYGAWLSTPSEANLKAFAEVFDFVAIDTQHSTITNSDARALLGLLQGVSTRAVVRVAANDAAQIGFMLDCGADTIIVPVVETGAESLAAVKACFFPPRGNRSYGPIRDDLDGLDTAELTRRVRCFVQIETAEGMANAEEIVATPGLAGIYVGPSDLSIAYGLDPIEGFTTSQLREEFDTLRQVCDRYGVELGTHALDLESVHQFVEWGATFLPAVNDVQFIRLAARQVMTSLRVETEEHTRLKPTY